MGVWYPKELQAGKIPVVIRNLSSAARQAIIAAGGRVGFQQGTWNGCVFNAASGSQVNSTLEAAELFGMDRTDVMNFISWWDRLRKRGPAGEVLSGPAMTTWLVEQVKAAEIVAASDSKSFTIVAHKSDKTRAEEEFNSLVSSLDIPCEEKSETESEFADAVNLAGDLLFANA